MIGSIQWQDMKAELHEDGTWVVEGDDSERVQVMKRALDRLDTEDRAGPFYYDGPSDGPYGPKLLEAVARHFGGTVSLIPKPPARSEVHKRIKKHLSIDLPPDEIVS